MQEGTSFFVFGVPPCWPPNDILTLKMALDHTSRLDLMFWPDGHPTVRISVRGTSKTWEASFQPVLFTAAGPALVSIRWKLDDIELRVNGTCLKDWASAPDTPVLFKVNDQRVLAHAFEDDEIAQRECQHWIAHRARAYATRAAGSGRQLLSPEEELRNLREAIGGLRVSLARVRDGGLETVPSIAASLRALVVEQLDRRTNLPRRSYSPLLFRVAATHHLPLPVYAAAERTNPKPDVVRDAQFALLAPSISVCKKVESETLMDLQEAMSCECLLGTWEGDPGPWDAYKVVKKCAETMGGAHYDAAIETPLLQMEACGTERFSTRVGFLVGLAEVVIDLGDYIISKAGLSLSTAS